MPRRRDPSSARTHSVRVAVRAADLAEYRAEARERHISVSALLYARLMGSRPVSAVDSRTAGELGRIGAVLNQIARRIHMGLQVELSDRDLRPLMDELTRLRLVMLGAPGTRGQHDP